VLNDTQLPAANIALHFGTYSPTYDLVTKTYTYDADTTAIESFSYKVHEARDPSVTVRGGVSRARDEDCVDVI
jgi:hypothetical protein